MMSQDSKYMTSMLSNGSIPDGIAVLRSRLVPLNLQKCRGAQKKSNNQALCGLRISHRLKTARIEYSETAGFPYNLHLRAWSRRTLQTASCCYLLSSLVTEFLFDITGKRNLALSTDQYARATG